MEYKLRVKALCDLSAADSYILNTITHLTEAKQKILFMTMKTRLNYNWVHYYFY